MTSSITAGNVRKKFVTAQDINQLRQCFYAMEEIAQTSIAKKNKQIQELQEEIAELKEAIEQRSRQVSALTVDISSAKSKLRVGGVTSASDDLLDLIEAQQQHAAEELRRKNDELRQVDARLTTIDNEKRELKNQLDYYVSKIENLRHVILDRAGGDRAYGDDDRDVVMLLEDRLGWEDRQLKDRESKLDALQLRLDNMQYTLEEKSRAADRLAEEKREANEKLRYAKEALFGSKLPSHFKFVQPQNKYYDGDLLQILDNRDREIIDELNARDDELADVRSRLRTLEDSMQGKAAEVERLRRELAAADEEREAKASEVEHLNEHAKTQANVIRRKIEELEERDRDVGELKRRVKAIEDELDERLDQIESNEEELRSRDEQISLLQRKVQMAQEEVGSKLVVLSLLLEKLTAAREEFESKDDEIDQLSDRLHQVEEERRGMEESLRRFKDEEFHIMEDNAGQSTGIDRNENIPSKYADDKEEELDKLFKTARHTLGVLGEKANFSFAALKTKDDLDALYHEQLTVTGAEMILRDKKINLLVEKVEVAERYINEMLKVLGQKGLMKFGSIRSTSGSRLGRQDSMTDPAAYDAGRASMGGASTAYTSYQPTGSSPVGGPGGSYRPY